MHRSAYLREEVNQGVHPAWSSWSREHANLKKQAAFLERDVRSLHRTQGNLQQEMAILVEGDRTAAGERLTQVERARQLLEAHKTKLSMIKSRVRQAAPGAHLASEMDSTLRELEEQLKSFRCGMKKDYQQLTHREKKLWREVGDIQRKMAEWEKIKREEYHPASVQKAWVSSKWDVASGEEGAIAAAAAGGGGGAGGAGTEAGAGEGRGLDPNWENGRGLRELVERLDTLIAREGGATGGWPQHEHDSFLRLWTQVNRAPFAGTRMPPCASAGKAAVDSLVARANIVLSSRGPDEVREHQAWYERYCGYLEEKRRLAKRWREHRRNEQGEKAGTAAGAFEGESRAEERARKMTTEAAAVTARERERERERERKRREIDEWRAAKEAKERAREEEHSRQTREQEADGAAKVKRQQRRRREQVAAYRRERDREESRRREVERMLAREQRRHSLAELEVRVKQDVEKARRRRQEASEREEERVAEERRRREVVGQKWATVRADRSRVSRATKASRERMLQPEDLDDVQDARTSQLAHQSRVPITGRDLRFTGRATPSWMAGVTLH